MIQLERTYDILVGTDLTLIGDDLLSGFVKGHIIGSIEGRRSSHDGKTCECGTLGSGGTCARTTRTTRPRSIKVGKERIKYRCVTLQPCIHDVGIGQVFAPHFNVDDIACSQGCLRKLPLKITHECG